MGWKEIEFAGGDSEERLRRIQALCASSTSSTKGFDGILVVGGIDSQNAQFCQALIKYLLLGSSGQELLGEQVITQENERLEDIILLIERQRVSIFYSSESESAVKILPIISRWRNVTEYVINDSMDQDEQEKRKIESFKKMVHGLSRVAIPYGVDKNGKDLEDVMIPEKWPLVQSYGLDEVSQKGFFTMNHQVINCSAALRDVMAKIDDFTARRIVQEVEPLLSHHFHQFLSKQDHFVELPEQQRTPKTETELAEDLISFYEFGTMQYASRGVSVGPARGSRVLYGNRTNDLTLKSSSTINPANAGVKEFSASHFVVQTEDPFTGVRFTRSYFLGTGKVSKRIVDEEALVHPKVEKLDKYGNQSDNSVDTNLLIELYVLLLKGFKTSIESFISQQLAQSGESLNKILAAAKESAVKAMTEYSRTHSYVLGCKKFSTLPATFIDSALELDIEVLDSRGQATTFPGGKWNLVYISLALRKIPSQVHGSESLGSLVVGDTILFKQSTPKYATTSHISVTNNFPYFKSWIQNGKEADFSRAVEQAMNSEFLTQGQLKLGKELGTIDGLPVSGVTPSTPRDEDPALAGGVYKAQLLLDIEDLPLLQGKLRLFSSGFYLKTPNVNPIVVSFARHVKNFRIVPTKHEELVLLEIDLKDQDEKNGENPIMDAIPFVLKSSTIALPLLAGTRFQEELLKVLGVWKTSASQLSIPFYRPDDISSDGSLTARERGNKNGAPLSPVLAKTAELLVKKRNSTRQVILDAYFPKWFIPKDSNPVTTLPKPKADTTKMTVPITVLVGVPGSNVGLIGETIRDISQSTNNWIPVTVDSRNAKNTVSIERYISEAITTQVKKALETIKAKASTYHQYPRILLTVVGYVDPITIAQTLKSKQDTFSVPSKISSIITCLNASNLFVPDPFGSQSPLPKLVDQLTPGFVTHVVVSNSSEVSSAVLGRLRYRIDQTNPFAELQVLHSNVFEGPITPLLAVERFESAYYHSYRQEYFPKWESDPSAYVADANPLPESVRLEISSGFDKETFLELIGKMLTPYACSKSISGSKTIGASKGIRLAQSIATDKVLQSKTLANGAPIVAADTSRLGTVWSIEGRVTFANDPSTVYEYLSTGSHANLRVLSDASATDGSFELKITGLQLDGDRLRNLVLTCFPHIHAVQPLRTKLSVTLAEKREIQKKHAMDPVPEGYLFDGVSYVDLFGGRYEFHPNIQQFIDEHLGQSNEKTTKANTESEKNRKTAEDYVTIL